MRRWLAPLLWAIALAVALVAIIAGWRLQSGLDVFLTDEGALTERVLTRQLREQGLGGLIFVLLGETGGAPAPEVVDKLRKRLAATRHFRLVASGVDSSLLGDIEPLFRYRYLLSDRTANGLFTQQRLTAAFRDLARQLQDSAAFVDETRAAADPTGELRYLLQRWFGGRNEGGGRWLTADGRAVVVALAAAPAYELDAQQRALAAIDEAVAAVGDNVQATVTGAPAIAVATQQTIRSEVTRISLYAAAGVVALLLLVLRSPRGLLLTVLPVITAIVAGMLAVLGVFGGIHGITLGFGATLLGITVDYPLHLLGQDGSAGASRRIAEPLLLSSGSTMLGFAAMGLSGIEGLQQLAVFAIAGLAAAVLTTLTVLPALIGDPVAMPWPTSWPSKWLQRAGRWAFVVLAGLLLAGGLLASQRVALEADLTALSPIPAELARADTKVREALGLPQPRHVVLVHGPKREPVLVATERVSARLDTLAREGALDRHEAVTQFVPSAAMQQTRQRALPKRATLAARVDTAVADLPLRAAAFEPFLADVAASRGLASLAPGDLDGGALGVWLSDLLSQLDGRWVSMLRLGGVRRPQALEALREQEPMATVQPLDLRAATETLVARYQASAIRHSLLGAGLIVVLLALSLRRTVAVGWIVIVMAGGIGAALIVLAVSGAQLSLFHLASLLLVAGLALDYGLFTRGGGRGVASTTVCAASTVIAFGALATASTPVLHDIATTVMTGVIAAWLLAMLATPTRQAL